MELHGMRVLAVGTRGAQGSGLVEALEARGAVPVRATTSEAQLSVWREQRTEAVLLDLTDTASVAAVTGDLDAAVLHLPLGLGSPDGVAAVVRSVEVLRRAGLAVALNLGTPVPPDGAPDLFGSRATATALQSLGAAAVAPTAYLENHTAPWALPPLEAGSLVYPRPAEDVVAWVAARDVTGAAVAALERDLGGELVSVAGPERLTFVGLAHELGTGTGRTVTFRRVTPQEYGDLLRPVVGPEAAAGVTAFYGAMPETPDPALAVDASATWRRLGHTPSTARRWAAEVLRPRLEARAA